MTDEEFEDVMNHQTVEHSPPMTAESSALLIIARLLHDIGKDLHKIAEPKVVFREEWCDDHQLRNPCWQCNELDRAKDGIL